jgi:hypothetical protein
MDMKRIAPITIVMLISIHTATAQSMADATTTKTQDEILDEFNSRNKVNIKLYPNPAVNYIIVETEIQQQTGEIRILDITGQVISTMHAEAGSNATTIDLSSYIPGSYLLALYNADGQLLQVRKFNKS